MKNKVEAETAKKLWAVRCFDDAACALDREEQVGQCTARSETKYNKALNELLVLLLGREPTEYEMHLARDYV